MKPKFGLLEAKQKIEAFCAYQERCDQEVRKKLKSWNMYSEDVDVLISDLISHNFLNEERFAKSFARGKFRIKSWGKQRIVNTLKFKDISAYIIKTALKEIDEVAYIETIYRITENRNKVIKETNDYKRKKKLIDFLMRKGFESDLIYKTVNEVVS